MFLVDDHDFLDKTNYWHIVTNSLDFVKGYFHNLKRYLKLVRKFRSDFVYLQTFYYGAQEFIRVLRNFCSFVNVFFMFDHVGNVVNLLLTFVICMIFSCSFHVAFALDEVMAEIISFGIHRSFSVIFLFLLDISWRTLFIKNLFWLILCSLPLLCIEPRIPVVIHGFFTCMWKTSFLTIIYPQQNLKACVAWDLLSKSVGWVSCYAKYIIFKVTRWTEILHVVAEFHSIFLHGRKQSPRSCLMKKNDYVWFALKDVQV